MEVVSCLFVNFDRHRLRIHSHLSTDGDGKEWLSMGKVQVIEDGNLFENRMFVQDIKEQLLCHLAFFWKAADEKGPWVRIGLIESTKRQGQLGQEDGK